MFKQKKITLGRWLDLPNAPVKRGKPEPGPFQERKTLAEWNRDPYLVGNNGKKTMRKPRRTR